MLLTAALAGGIASCVSTLALFPLDTLKTRMQYTAGATFAGIAKSAPDIGARGLYRFVLLDLEESTLLLVLHFCPPLHNYFAFSWHCLQIAMSATRNLDPGSFQEGSQQPTTTTPSLPPSENFAKNMLARADMMLH